MNILLRFALLLFTLIFFLSVSNAAHFETGSDIPTEELIARLEEVYSSKISGKKVSEVIVEGHADQRGNALYNLNLSQKRAESAARVLVKLGTKAEIISNGYGETQLVNLGTSDLDHANNRRVVVIVKSDEGESKTIISEAPEEKIVTKTIVVTKTVRKLNRISLLATQKRTGLTVNNGNNSTVIRSSTEIVPGLLYQRSFGDINGAIGIDVQGFGSVGIGLDF